MLSDLAVGVEEVLVEQSFTRHPEPVDYVLPSMVAGTVGALVSPGGAGKSMLALELAINVAGGADLLGLGPQDLGKVVYLTAEDPRPAVEHRLFAIGSYLEKIEWSTVASGLKIYTLFGARTDVMEPEWFDKICQLAGTGCRLLILDTLRRFHREEENDSGGMTKVIAQLEALATKTGCSLLFLHHASKAAAIAGVGDEQQASRGSSVLVDNIRWQGYVAGMSRKEAKEKEVDEEKRGRFARFGVSKANYGPLLPERWYRRHEGGVLLPATEEDWAEVHCPPANGKQQKT